MIKVLVIDDDRTIRLLLRHMIIEQLDWQVFEAGTAKEGLDLYRHQSPDIILLDLEMPDLDGDKLFTIIKKELKTQAVPVFIVTGIATRDRLLALINDGVAGIILKPFDMKDVASRLKTAMENLKAK